MHKDTKEALTRLEEALLAEEVLDMNDDDLDTLLEEFLEEDDGKFADHPAAYQNFANGYRIYNTDDTDEDMEVYSDAVLEEPLNAPMLLRIALVTALAGTAISLAYIVARCLR